MATITDGVGYGGIVKAGYPANAGETIIVKYDVTIDFAQVAAARAAAGLVPLAVGDILSIPMLPAQAIPLSTGFEVVKAETGAPTGTVKVDVGALAVKAAAVVSAVAPFAATAQAAAALAAATPMTVTIGTAVPLNAKVRATVVAIDPS